jgi:putative transposase
LADTLAEWPYSSYRDYAGLRRGTLCEQALGRELLALPEGMAAFVAESAAMVDPELVRKRWL